MAKRSSRLGNFDVLYDFEFSLLTLKKLKVLTQDVLSLVSLYDLYV